MLLAAIALTLLPQGTHLPSLQTTPASAPFFVAKAPLLLPSQSEAEATNWTLFDLVHAYEASTGHLVVATPRAEELLGSRSLLGETSETVPPEQVQKVFEAWLTEAGLILLPGKDHAPRLVGLSRRHIYDIGQLPLEPCLLDWTEVERYADHVGVLFQTIVPIQGADARRLANSMRGKIKDANVSQVLPLGRSNCLLVRGTGDEVASWTALLRESAREAGLVMPELKPAKAAPQRNEAMGEKARGLHLVVPARGDGAWNVSDLTREYSKLTGLTVTLDPAAAVLAESTPVGLKEDFSVTGADVPYTIEFLCRAKGFHFVLAEDGGALTLCHTQGSSPVTPTEHSLSDRASWAFHPALPVEVEVPMTEFDPRILANTLRVLIADANIDGMSVAPGTPSMKLRGFGHRVAAQVALFERAAEVASALRSADSKREE